MLFRVCSYSYAEVSVIGVQPFASSVGTASLVVPDSFYKFAGVSVSSRSRGEPLFSCHAVSSKSQYVVDAKECQIIKPAFYLFYGIAPADQMGHNIYIIS